MTTLMMRWNETAIDSRRRSAVLTGALWTLQILSAAMFLFAGGLKLAGAPLMVQEFGVIGLGQWFRYFTGTIEVVSAVLLLIPSLAAYGAAALFVTMIGAIVASETLLLRAAARSAAASTLCRCSDRAERATLSPPTAAVVRLTICGTLSRLICAAPMPIAARPEPKPSPFAMRLWPSAFAKTFHAPANAEAPNATGSAAGTRVLLGDATGEGAGPAYGTWTRAASASVRPLASSQLS